MQDGNEKHQLVKARTSVRVVKVIKPSADVAEMAPGLNPLGEDGGL